MAGLMRVLVTGSTGFIGGALCAALTREGHSVRAFHRTYSNTSLLKDLAVEHAAGDLTDLQSIREAMRDIDVVFHTAALMESTARSGWMYRVTVEGTRTLLDTALEFGVKRVIHTSSVAALGLPLEDNVHQSPQEALWMDENHSWNYRPEYWPYGYHKYLAELEVQKVVSRGLDAVIVNPSYVIGAGDIYRKSRSIIVKVAQRRIPFLPTGGFNAVHIDDVVSGHLAAMQKGATGERYILGGVNLTFVDFIQKISEIVGVSGPRLLVPGAVIRKFTKPLKWVSPILNLPVTIESIHQAGYGFYYSNKKAVQQLGLAAPKPVEEAIQSAVDWFREVNAF